MIKFIPPLELCDVLAVGQGRKALRRAALVLVFERRENHFERRVRARLRDRTFVRRFRKLFFLPCRTSFRFMFWYAPRLDRRGPLAVYVLFEFR